jgi:hypothetical protein
MQAIGGGLLSSQPIIRLATILYGASGNGLHVLDRRNYRLFPVEQFHKTTLSNRRGTIGFNQLSNIRV